jgi:methyl-accepting chemotaxis protein
MKVYSDLETAKQLEELWYTIEKGITLAKETLEKAELIKIAIIEKNLQIQEDKKEVSQLYSQTKDKASEILQTQLKIQELITNVESSINEIGGKKGLDNLQTDHQVIHNILSEARAEIERLHKKLEMQAKKEQVLRVWLFGVSFGILSLGLIVLK